MGLDKIRVLIVDDSAIIRNLLSIHLGKFDDIEIIGTAVDAYDARDKIVQLKPDVITLDLEMPKMNGLEFITVLMEHLPLPIVVFSSIVDGNCETSLKALELGALEVVSKPTQDLDLKMATIGFELANRIRSVRGAKIQKVKHSQNVIQSVESLSNFKFSDRLILIGSSTGGTEIIKYILMNLPTEIPPVLIVQHMPEGYTNSFAKRLNESCTNLQVKEAQNGEILHVGNAYIAPGDQHMLVGTDGAKFKALLNKSPKVNRFRPSVDVLFNSAIPAGKKCIGIILTGMGDDGAEGMLSLKKAGAKTIAQSEKSCAVFGMPAAAIRKNAVDFIEDYMQIPERLLQLIRQ